MKDAKGHGSDAKGGGFKAHDGKTYELAHRPGLYAHLGMTDAQSTKVISDKNAADELARGNPKAAAAPVHPAMGSPNSQGHAYGSPEAIRDFTKQYGGPRDHAAEARGFNRGYREINRLARQGK